ncbi:PhzF family phenazine biosynthesis isomerase [Alphaproteobacteria bacterium GH1-50]|uniref:PhzF family phenazine biosynthesis isomerase n=1 Tax=Kangsaoukella pontilimi TaxID=2691042 RepID=A0A7C9MQN3_9RHOB|nr:PhzF family phenazine biosynthesis protein [Kangsaoukella pontilimi]MXQ07557.1 PhzF family phenazine biosynthesis isomerase [Kangsaoukella pontilimi]
MTEYLVYDVFSDRPFAGNPLAVIPDASGLPEASLQKIAREFNFSETTFVFPPDAPEHHARVRIFTPTQEIPFAGHPTIGTAVALSALGRIPAEAYLELGVGPIPVRVDGSRASFVTEVPLQTWDSMTVEDVAVAAGLTPEDIRTDRHAPVIASVGLPFAVVELTDRETLARAAPNAAAFQAFRGFWPGSTHFDLLIYVRNGNRIDARMFAPLDGVPEDPATGSAACALAAYLGTLDGQSATFDVRQGDDMGRPSRITAEVTHEDGQHRSVRISGEATRVMAGRLTL